MIKQTITTNFNNIRCSYVCAYISKMITIEKADVFLTESNWSSECPGGLHWKQVSIYINNKSQVNFRIFWANQEHLFQF